MTSLNAEDVCKALIGWPRCSWVSASPRGGTCGAWLAEVISRYEWVDFPALNVKCEQGHETAVPFKTLVGSLREEAELALRKYL